jgi:dihydrofolate reductase
VFFSVSMSLDGFIAPASLGELMGQQWMELQQWIFPQRFFRENLKLGEGGEEGRDNDIARETFERTGASVMGKRMFDAGEQAWPEEAPFHTPVFVVTHEKRDPWERPGGTTFHFVNDGIEPALDQAREPPATGTSASRAAAHDPGVRERRPDRRVLDRALTRAVRLRNPPVRGRGRGPRGPGAGPRGADAAGDPPDLRSPGAVPLSGEEVLRQVRRGDVGASRGRRCFRCAPGPGRRAPSRRTGRR